MRFADDVEPAPRAKDLFDEPFHRGAIAGIGVAHDQPRIVRRTGQVAKQLAQGKPSASSRDRYPDMRALLEIRPQDRRADVPGGARKYYGALERSNIAASIAT